VKRCPGTPIMGCVAAPILCVDGALLCAIRRAGIAGASQSFATVPQLEAEVRQRLAARDANGALAAYQKLAE
jgi:hypothetical protein